MACYSRRRTNAPAGSEKNAEPSAPEGQSPENPLHDPMWEKLHPEQRDRMAAVHVLGHLFYWAATVAAVIGFVVAILTVNDAPRNYATAIGIAVASAVIWGVGRILRFLLSGK